MASFRTELLSKVAQELDQATQWLDELGVNWKPTRIRPYVHLVQRFAEASAQERNSILARDRIAIYNASLEIKDLLRCFEAFAGKFDGPVRDRIRTFVGGPERYSLENSATATNHPRNIGFELRLLASLVRAGAEPEFKSHADVSALYKKRTLHFECKRPQSPAALRPRIREAGKQLDRTLSASFRVRTRGIVAIDTTKIGNPSLRLARFEDRGQLARAFDARCQSIGVQILSLLPAAADSRVIGVLIQHRDIAVVPTRDGPDPYTCESDTLVVHPGCSRLDSQLLRKLVSDLAPPM